MRIGLKLHADFDSSEPYRRLYGTADVPSRLRELGIEAVEIPLHPDSDLEHIAAQARRCRGADLRVSFHPYSEGQGANPAQFAGPSSVPAVVHERFLALAARVAANQGDTVVNIHPAAVREEGESRRTLVDRSVAFFDWARTWCDSHARDVRPVAELQVAPFADEPIVRVGDEPAELDNVVVRSGVGACWDVGHAVWNHRRFGSDEQPADPLLARIAHVHCHDVGRPADGQAAAPGGAGEPDGGDSEVDHRPPRRGAAPWRTFVQRLAAAGYARTVIIEVGPPTFLTCGGLPAVKESIAAVREAAAVTR